MIAIFEDLSYAALSKIYRELRCQYHLIQEHPAEPPSIPALTPEGFEAWITLMIRAHPDVEYERLAKAVLDMPISNADDRKERFPKQLPRRLLPATENLQAQQRCAAALSSAGVGPLRRAPIFPPPPSKTQYTTDTDVPNLERERSPYTSRPDIRAFPSEEGVGSPSVPIERERKPYTSTPGVGKTYNDDFNRNGSDEETGHAPHRWTQSTVNPPSFATPWPETHHHPRTHSNFSSFRPKSPTSSNYGTESDPNIHETFSSYYASGFHSFDDDPREYSQETGGNTFYRHRRRMGGSFEPHPRSVYDDDDYRERHRSSGYDGRDMNPAAID